MREAERRERAAASTDGWSAHEARQREAWSRTTPLQRLEWLEDAKRFAARALAASRRPLDPGAETE